MKNSILLFLFVALCAAVLVRTWATDGLSFRLLPPVFCLLLWWLAMQQIINKKIKIPSPTVTAIKHEMQQLLEREENCAPAIQGGTSDQPNNKKSRQGETPEVSPLCSALPP
jgi:hypothetical protein